MYGQFEDEEMKLLENLHMDNGDNRFDRQEYLLFCLIRGKIIDMELVDRIFEKFDQLDSQHQGHIYLSDIIESGRKQNEVNRESRAEPYVQLTEVKNVIQNENS